MIYVRRSNTSQQDQLEFQLECKLEIQPDEDKKSQIAHTHTHTPHPLASLHQDLVLSAQSGHFVRHAQSLANEVEAVSEGRRIHVGEAVLLGPFLSHVVGQVQAAAAGKSAV